MNNNINETIASMTQASMPGALLSHVAIIGANPEEPSIVLAILHNSQYLWCYRQGHGTIYGTFYMGMRVQRTDQGGEGDSPTFAVQTNEYQPQRFAIKWVSIQQYRENGMEMEEDPYNEIRIKSHICRYMRLDQITNSGIIIPVGVVSNETQANIGDDEKYFFILSQLANGGDLYEAVMGEGDGDMAMDVDTIRHLFRQMVRAIHCLHQLRVFHRDLSVENFVINNNGDDDQRRIYVIDFGQARVVDPAHEDLFRHDDSHFGKPAYTPPELIHGHINLYWKKVDVWALGVTLYYMFLRQPPLWSISDGGLSRTNVGHPAFGLLCRQGRLAQWLRRNGVAQDRIPDEAVEVLQGMLREDPEHRLSTEEILNHPWLA